MPEMSRFLPEDCQLVPPRTARHLWDKLMIRICLIRKPKWVESLVILRTDGWNFRRVISMSKGHYLLQTNHGHLELTLMSKC